MPTFELIGKGANGRPDTLQIPAARKADAVAQAQALGFTVQDVREINNEHQPAQHLHARQVTALETIAASRIIRQPISTIGWGVVVSGVFLLLIGLGLTLAMLSAGMVAERAANAGPPPAVRGRSIP